ncbi:hypothetical protein [Rubrobacter aplysinae]|uniref:hypothetical protein n=1 Tax=Rubrobacter aplysinae TaxID=909625 RepID=UPI00128CF0C7|nr:hypothetical protein [Rubrobacter aplysinae]
MTMRFCFPQLNKIHEISKRPILAVDLGFANRKKSCGLASQEVQSEECQVKDLDFGHCVQRTVEFLSENKDSVLIVEAPLSGLFDFKGNPKGRLPFEKGETGTNPRYWYTGAGASVGLGAIFFFSRLRERLGSTSNATVSVVEGFISFKTSPTKDSEDALALLKAFRNSHEEGLYEVTAGMDERSTSFLSFAGLCLPEASCPLVLAVDV